MKTYLLLVSFICTFGIVHAQRFVVDDLVYQLNSDGKSVSLSYSGFEAWNWKSANNYAQSSIIVPDSITIDDVTYPVTAIADRALNNSHNLTEVSLPKTITSIGSYAFSCCNNLKELILPESLQTIYSWAFFNCQFNKLFIPSSLKEIGGTAFYSEISGDGAFNVYITDLNSWLSISFNNYDSNPTRVHFFLNDEPIKSLVIPDDIAVVNKCACMYIDCETVTIPDHVTDIGEYAFYGCKAESITIGDGVKEIDPWALSYCSYKTIELGENIETIHSPNFNQIPNLTTVICHSITPPTLSGYQFFTYFHGRDDDEDPYDLSSKTLIVPKGTREVYKNAPKWNEFGIILEEGEDATNIESIGLTDKDNPNIYTLDGYHVLCPNRGLSIINGKKIYLP